eukprot:SAG31_NODE_3856_length_3815_cov_3.607374_1_plen_173_part_10
MGEGVWGEGAAAPSPHISRRGQRARPRCCWWPCWRPPAASLLAGAGLRHPWVSPCPARGRWACVLPARGWGGGRCPHRGAREGVLQQDESEALEAREVGKCATIRFTEHFPHHAHPLGHLLTDPHPLCCSCNGVKNRLWCVSRALSLWLGGAAVRSRSGSEAQPCALALARRR